MRTNHFESRLAELKRLVRTRNLDAALVHGEANVRALTGVDCDNACLLVRPEGAVSQDVFFTDFRYVPMVHRTAPFLAVRDLRRLGAALVAPAHLGCEFEISHARYLRLVERFPKAEFVDLSRDLAALRAVKTPDEIAALRAAESLNDAIWSEASARFAPGMTEREMARIIRVMMIERGDGEAFETIVCVGANAAECHHVPDDTVWNGREPVLVDMGVKLGGVCSDLTRNLVPKRPRPIYRQIYELVREANRAAIAAVKPGITGRRLDKVARDIIRKGGFGRCFGHSLGHGVGYEIHEQPTASKRSDVVLKSGMVLTIEPGVYLEGNLGVRIEDMVLVTDSGCEVLSSS